MKSSKLLNVIANNKKLATALLVYALYDILKEKGLEPEKEYFGEIIFVQLFSQREELKDVDSFLYSLLGSPEEDFMGRQLVPAIVYEIIRRQ